jgi:hypothetical protein
VKVIEEQEVLMIGPEPVDREQDPKEIKARDEKPSLWERWKDWASIIDR